MKQIIIILIVGVLCIVAFLQLCSQEREIVVEFRECKEVKIGLMYCELQYGGKTYSGGEDLAAAAICKELTPETKVVLTQWGMLTDISLCKW